MIRINFEPPKTRTTTTWIGSTESGTDYKIVHDHDEGYFMPFEAEYDYNDIQRWETMFDEDEEDTAIFTTWDDCLAFLERGGMPLDGVEGES
jgi:hypothetical protein